MTVTAKVKNKAIQTGRIVIVQGEHNADTIVFSIRGETGISTYHYYMVYKRPDDTTSNVVALTGPVVTTEGYVNVWFNVSSTFTEQAGNVRIQIFAHQYELDDYDTAETAALWQTLPAFIYVHESQLASTQDIIEENVLTEYLSKFEDIEDEIESDASDVRAHDTALTYLDETGGTNVDAVADNETNINTVATDLAGTDTIGTVAGAIANVNTVATNITDVGTVASNVVDVGTVADDLDLDANSAIKKVANNIGNVVTVSGIGSEVTSVSQISTDVQQVSGIRSDVSSVAQIDDKVSTVAGIASDVSAVSGISTDVSTVSGIASDVTAVAGNASDISSVASNNTNITTVATNITNVNSVASIDDEVTTVAGISSDVTNVSGISSDVTTVSGSAANVRKVALIESSVTSVADNIAKVVIVGNNLAGILASETNASLSRQYSEGKKLDGTDVTSGEEGYENNAKYYADQAGSIVVQSVTSGDTTHAPSGDAVYDALALKQDVSNLVTSFQVSPDDTHYPSEKLVHDTTSALSGQIANLDFGETEASEDVVFEGDQETTWAEQTFPSIPTESNDGIFLCKADSAPSTSTDTGIVGQYFADTDYLYICIATNTWRRVALTTF